MEFIRRTKQKNIRKNILFDFKILELIIYPFSFLTLPLNSRNPKKENKALIILFFNSNDVIASIDSYVSTGEDILI